MSNISEISDSNENEPGGDIKHSNGAFNALKKLNLDLLKFKQVIEKSNDAIVIISLQENKLYLNKIFVDMLGYTTEELQEIGGLFKLYTDSNLKDIIPRMLLSGNYWQGDITLRTRAGNIRELYLSAGPVFNDQNELIAIYGIHTDISEHKQAREKIRESLTEKEVLLSEIHHRVKNNLALVSSMLQLQALQENNHELNSKLIESSLRIKTIATIHEQLYESESFSKINFTENISSLIARIVETISNKSQIGISLDCAPVHLNVNQAITCSLIVNEVVTNIVKHAFDADGNGNISVIMREQGDQVCLTIRDDGPGLPEDIEFNNEDEMSLGLNIINLLTKQLGASYKYDSSDGCRFTLELTKNDSKGICNADLE